MKEKYNIKISLEKVFILCIGYDSNSNSGGIVIWCLAIEIKKDYWNERITFINELF